MRHFGTSLVAALAVVVTSGCPRLEPGPVQDAGAPPSGAGTPCDGACTADEQCDAATNTCALNLAALCRTGTAPWAPGTKAFVDATSQWGLDLGLAEGTRISSTDIDGDGDVDLAVRKAGNTRDNPDAGARAVWLLRNTGSTFEDITAHSGLLANRTETTSSLGRPAEIIVFADVDNDGDVDAFTGASATAAETSELMLNDGTGTFTPGPAGSEFRRTRDAIAGASFADINVDGKVDLWIGGTGVAGGGSQSRLYIGDGVGTFYEETQRAGLTTKPWTLVSDLNEAKAHSYSWGTNACDLNGDGLPELLSASYGRAPNLLFQSVGVVNGVATYENRSLSSGYAFDEGVDWTDNESARCWCKLHPTDEGCPGVPPPQYIQCTKDSDAFRWYHPADRQPYRLGGNNGTTVCGDLDGDGDLDLLNTTIVHWDVGSSSDPTELLLNSGEPDTRFTRPGNAAMGLTRTRPLGFDDGDITGAMFDFDNDGRLDVYVGSTDYPDTRGWLYHQNEGGTLTAVPLADGIDHQSSHGIAVADFDRDGDLDVVVGHSRSRCNLGTHCYPKANARFFENQVGEQGNFVQLQLQGAEGTNRAAIGARVTVKANGRTQSFEVGGGHGHYGLQHDFVVHAGLGSACEAEVTVKWPNAAHSTQTFTLPAGHRFHLEEGGRPTKR